MNREGLATKRGMNKSELLALLERLEIHPSRRLGQNFLIDPNMLDSLVRSAGVVEGDTILEIGPGTGTLTERMLAAGARVQAIELDHRLAGYLRDERFKDDKAFSLLEADACRTDLDSLMGEAPFRCVANLPYSCSSQLLASLTSMTNQPQDIHVLLQKEMADRLTAKAGTKEYGVLTVRLGLLYEISTVKTIPKNVFFPPPEVVSAFVRMRLRPKRPPRDVMASVSHVAGLAFGQRRKKTCRMLEPEYGAERVAAAFAAASLTEDVRADAITPQAYVRLGMELMKQ
ncbi:MAG: 16S rRNA (adenine(1518)-N(6)/adenine(1519)-N(6))-dimethyltransferase RsmA [Lentisphaeria bacterium]|nr:16S rRNA (adenine(1518)-N(6)/adenine(1519)-N(6))-dimethyltransferase RsmA [Lentisphaeria bacterium]